MPITVRYDVPAETAGPLAYQGGYDVAMGAQEQANEQRRWQAALQEMQAKTQRDTAAMSARAAGARSAQASGGAMLSNMLQREWELEDRPYKEGLLDKNRDYLEGVTAKDRLYTEGQNKLANSRADSIYERQRQDNEASRVLSANQRMDEMDYETRSRSEAATRKTDADLDMFNREEARRASSAAEEVDVKREKLAADAAAAAAKNAPTLDQVKQWNDVVRTIQFRDGGRDELGQLAPGMGWDEAEALARRQYGSLEPGAARNVEQAPRNYSLDQLKAIAQNNPDEARRIAEALMAEREGR